MPQTSIVRGTATNIRTDANGTHVRYHHTDVVTFTDDTVILRTGGWRTNTTRLRMNQASNQFGLRYQVFQRDFEWFVQVGSPEYGHTERFDGERMELDRKVLRKAA